MFRLKVKRPEFLNFALFLQASISVFKKGHQTFQVFSLVILSCLFSSLLCVFIKTYVALRTFKVATVLLKWAFIFDFLGFPTSCNSCTFWVMPLYWFWFKYSLMLCVELAHFTCYLRWVWAKSHVPGSSCWKHIETTWFGVTWLVERLCCYCWISSGCPNIAYRYLCVGGKGVSEL